MIKQAKLGQNGPQIGRLGYGAMVLEGYYGESDDNQVIETLLHAVDAGMMIDTADAYGGGHNESLLAKELNISPAQLALAWLLHQGQDIFPIPGTRSIQRIDENAAALNIELDAATLQRINELAKPGLAEGATLI